MTGDTGSRRPDDTLSRRLIPVLVLVAATLVVHAPRSADSPYDEKEFVVSNESIRSLEGAFAALALPFPPEQPQRGLYRPLTNLSYALDYAAWGDRAQGFHATNVLLYAASVLLVQRLALAYLGSASFAFSVALLFARHPVHCDAVDSVAGRSELLALAFSLVSLLLFLRATRDGGSDGRWLLGSAAAQALACLSKETGAVLPAILVAHRLVLAPPPPATPLRGWLARLRPLLPHLAVLVAYLAVRTLVLGRFAPEAAILRDEDLATRLFTIGTVFLVNLQLLVWPSLQVDFFYQATLPLPRSATPAALLGWLLILAAVAATLWLVRAHFGRRSRDRPGRAERERASALCALSILFATLLPTSHVLDFGALLAERFLFAPSLGFLLLVVLAARRIPTQGLAAPARRIAGALLLAAVAGAWGLRSHARALEWRDPVLLWSETARALPGDRRVHTNLAAAHLERGELELARTALERALDIDPDYAPALGNLGVLQLEQGQLEAAAATYRRLLELDPRDFLAWYNLGLIEVRRENPARAAEHFRRSLQANPNFSQARRGLEVAERRLAEPAGGGALPHPDQRR